MEQKAIQAIREQIIEQTEAMRASLNARREVLIARKIGHGQLLALEPNESNWVKWNKAHDIKKVLERILIDIGAEPDWEAIAGKELGV